MYIVSLVLTSAIIKVCIVLLSTCKYTIKIKRLMAVYKTCNRTKPNRTYGNYRTYPAEPTEIIEHPDRTYGNYDLSIPGINCITCQNGQNFEDQAPISLFTKDFM